MFVPKHAIHVIAMSAPYRTLFNEATLIDTPEVDALTPAFAMSPEEDTTNDRGFDRYRVTLDVFVVNTPDNNRAVVAAQSAPVFHFSTRKVNHDLNRIVVPALEGVIILTAIGLTEAISPKSIRVQFHGIFHRGKIAIGHFQRN